MSAAALTTACTTPFTHSSETYKGKPTATYSAGEIPGQPHQYSLPETFNALAKDPNIQKDGKSINIKPIADQYKKDNYVQLTSTNPKTNQEEVLDESSAPVMEVKFNRAEKTFTYKAQTPKGLNNQELYQLLLPVTQNETLLKTAFENNDVSRVAIRLGAPYEPTPGVPATYTSDEYVQEDWSTPKEGMQKTVYLFLPGIRSIDTQEIRDTLRHETIHGLTGKDSLSDSDEAPAPNHDELIKWNAACKDIREFSLQDAEKHKQKALENIATLNSHLDNPTAKEILAQITDALKKGTFDKYQLQQGDNTNEAFMGKIPDCITIGPWEVFVRLMNEKGLNSAVNKIVESTDVAVGDAYAALQDNWQNMMEFQTIYSVLREGTYEKDAPDKLLGHEFGDWDELITSISDVSLAYPKNLAASIKQLPPERRATALQLVNLSLSTLNSQIPVDKNPDFHALMTTRLATINQLS